MYNARCGRPASVSLKKGGVNKWLPPHLKNNRQHRYVLRFILDRYARDDRFAEVVEQQVKAYELLPEKRKTGPEGQGYLERLELYRKEQAFVCE
jgi:hypothetical protein